MKPSFAPAIARPAPRPAPASRSVAAAVPRFVSTPLGAGAPMSSGVKPRLEHSFGADLSGVRVHTETSASRVADAVGAKAFAHGSDIVLSSRASANDLGLMAHETAHVLQQNSGPARVQTFGGALGCGYEREAHSASAAVMRGERYVILHHTGGAYPQFGFWSSLVSAVTEGIGGLIDKAIAYIRDNARSIPGYDLLAVAIGKDPLTQQTVDRSAENIIKGLIGLIPGGAAMFENIQKAGVIQRAADWVDAELKRLNLSWERVKATISEFIGSLGASDLLDLGGVFTRAKRIFGPLVSDIVTFAKGAAAKLFEFIFEGALALAGSAGQQVLAVLRKAGAVLKQIMEDPIGFLNNLLAAVFGGFKQFGANILTHLKNAIFDWLFGAMAGAGIQLPKKFDLKGILSVVLQVLGLTWQNMRGKLVKVLGEPVVAGLEKTFEFIKLLVTEGIGAAWQKILEFASGITDTVIEGIKSWVKTTIVGQAITKIVSMANPAGAIIQAVIAIYNTVMFVIERAKQIMAFVSSVTDSIANIAAGRVSAAINYVEQTLARILPLVISFLARFIGLGGISAKIKDIIAKIRAPIDKAIDKIVDWLAAQARKLAQSAASAVQVSGTPEERLRGGLQAAQAAVNRLGTSPIGLAVLRPILSVIKVRYGMQSLEPEANDGRWRIVGVVNPMGSVDTDGTVEGDDKNFPTKITYFAADSRRGGKKMTADPLGRDHPTGTKVSAAGAAPIWALVNIRRPKNDKRLYVLGHLLNNNLGGTGDDMRNLTPITFSANSNHLHQVEKHIKEVVNASAKKAKRVKYTVEVHYPATPIAITPALAKKGVVPAEGELASHLTFAWQFLKTDPKDPKKLVNDGSEETGRVDNIASASDFPQT